MFHTTRWSVVLGARTGDAEGRRALETLCASYWPPIFAVFRRRGLDADAAADATQEFFGGLLARQDLRRVDPLRGRFRAWLQTALGHFLVNEWKKADALKRGGGRGFLAIDAREAEEHFARVGAACPTPEEAFARTWALALLERVLVRLGDDYARAGQAELFAALRGTLTAEGSEQALGAIALELGKSPGALKVAAHRLRQRYRELVRLEVAETLPDPNDREALEDELRGLFEALASGAPAGTDSEAPAGT